jgi:flagellar biosynthesis/type III secretory pathway M-ring protein FliF/YscJ
MEGPQTGAPVKLFLIGGVVGLVIGVVLTVLYFSLATFFSVQAKALDEQQEAEEERNKNAQDKKPGRVGQDNPGLGREVPSPAKDKSRRRIRAWPT